MKALSLDQPWASLVAAGLKTNETRCWSTSYRGPLLIHATVKWRRQEKEAMERLYAYREVRDALYGEPWTGVDRWALACNTRLPLGCALAIVRLEDVIETTTWIENTYRPQGGARSLEVAAGDYSPGRFAWILRDLKRLEKPIPMKGGQRIWNAPDVSV